MLDKAFGLKQIWTCDLMQRWQNHPVEVHDNDRENILVLQSSLIRGGRAWNETELENKFISPMIMAARIDDEQIGYFLERPLKGIVGEYELSGIVDGMIATGFREPDIPYFCIHEYKKSIENQGSPDAQVLVAMLVAREQNPNPKHMYGMFVVGFTWNFIVLNGKEYCISNDYKSDDEEVFDIFKMLKAVKHIIKTELL